MSWGLAGALIACLCYGVATVFQAMGARRVAGSEGDGTFTGIGRWVLLGVSLLLAVLALVLGNVYKSAHPALLGTVAGFLFGVFGIAVRILPSVRPAELVTDPAAYAAVIASVTGFLFFTTALQRGSVNATAAALVVGETAVPALIGLTLLGDSARPGYGIVGVFGFLMAVGGALALARFAELPAPDEGADTEGDGSEGGDGAAPQNDDADDPHHATSA